MTVSNSVMNSVSSGEFGPSAYLEGVGDLQCGRGYDSSRLAELLGSMHRTDYQPSSIDGSRVHQLVHQDGKKGDAIGRFVSKFGVGKVAYSGRINKSHLEPQHTVKNGKPTDQKSSGRCWIFGGLNMMRIPVLEEYGEDFEYSENFVAFWDKFERANFFLEKLVEMKDFDPRELRLMNLIEQCYADGGEWELFRNIVEKYGVVPKDAMPETEFSGNSRGYMNTLQERLRETGALLHQMARQGAKHEDLMEAKRLALDEVTAVLTKYLGSPPKQFVWKAKKGEIETLTPTEFYKQNPLNLSDMVHLVNLPYHDYNQVIKVRDVGNVVEGTAMHGLNVEMSVMKAAMRSAIKNGRSVLFGSETSEMDRQRGYAALDLDDSRGILGLDRLGKLNKADRLRYQVTVIAHLMNLVGCDDEGHARIKGEEAAGVPELYRQPVWKVENSWKGCEEVYFSDSWVDEYLYGVVVHKDDLPKEYNDLWKDQFAVKEVPAWDPFGRI